MQDLPIYPVILEVDYPEKLSRLTTFFRLILDIPVFLFAGLVSGWNIWDNLERGVIAGGGLFFPILVVVFIRQYIPHWIFNYQVALGQFANRVFAYVLLLTDQYPAFEGEYPVRYDVRYPEHLNRWKVLVWKLITAIPHFIILTFLWIAIFVAVLVAWFAILFTGRYPRGLHSFVVGGMRWTARVGAYVYSLTDQYPPFSLEP